MYSNINLIPPTINYCKQDNALAYYALLHAIEVHQFEYDTSVPDVDYATYCSDFIRGLSRHHRQWLKDVDYASYDHCEDVHSSNITWAIDCLIAYEKKEDLDRDLCHKWANNLKDEDLPF